MQKSIQKYGLPTVRLKPGKVGRYIQPFGTLRREDRVVLYVRVSSGSSSAASQLRILYHALHEKGVIVKGVVNVQCSGYDNPLCQDRPWVDSLLDAHSIAIRHGAKIVAAEANRFVRSCFVSKDWDAEATTRELEELKDWTQGIVLVSLAPPNATSREVRKAQSERGQGDNKGGRPTKPTRPRTYAPSANAAILARVKELSEAGMSLNEIASALSRSRSTVQGWKRRVYEFTE